MLDGKERSVWIGLGVAAAAMVAAQLGWLDAELAMMAADAVLDRVVKGGW